VSESSSSYSSWVPKTSSLNDNKKWLNLRALLDLVFSVWIRLLKRHFIRFCQRLPRQVVGAPSLSMSIFRY